MATSLISSIILTEAARAALDLTFKDREKPSLRIYLSFMSESGPRLELAPDVQTATDSVTRIGAWTIIINTQLLSQAAPLSIDVGPDGFVIHSSLDFSEAGGNCGGACGTHH